MPLLSLLFLTIALLRSAPLTALGSRDFICVDHRQVLAVLGSAEVLASLPAMGLFEGRALTPLPSLEFSAWAVKVSSLPALSAGVAFAMTDLLRCLTISSCQCATLQAKHGLPLLVPSVKTLTQASLSCACFTCLHVRPALPTGHWDKECLIRR